MINYAKYKNIFLKGIGSLWLFSIITNGEPITLEEIKQATDGKGVFSIAVTNNGKKRGEKVKVFVHLTNPPSGCEYLKFSSPQRRSSVYIETNVEANTTKIVELPVPFLSSQEGDEIEQYDNTDNLLPLSENSEVMVEVRSMRLSNEYGIHSLIFESMDYNLRSRGFNQAFKAKYLAGTRLIELPDQIQIAINYDDPVTDYDPIQEFIDLQPIRK